MGDWDDEEFEVPVVAPKAAVKAAWDDEDEIDNTPVVAAKPSAAVLEAAAKKARDEELALEAKLRNAALENETPEQKRLRERQQVEEADHAIAGELFGGAGTGKAPTSSIGSTSSSVKGLGAIALKTKQDHLTFGTTIAQKLSSSSAFNIAAFYKTLAKTLDQPTVTSEVLNEILAEINKIREAKLKLEKPAAKPTVAKKSKAAIAAEAKKHADKYGGSYDDVDKYDHYNDMEDDFM